MGNRFYTRVLALLVLALLVPGGSALASPYTLYFSGITTDVYDYSNNGSIPDDVGLPFSGWLAFDLANAQSNSSYDLPGSDHAYYNDQSWRGCDLAQNGVCTKDHGAGPLLVTGYSFTTPFAPPGGYQPIPASANFADRSVVQNYRYYPPGYPPNGLDQYLLLRSQSRESLTGDLNGGAFQDVYDAQYLLLVATRNDNSLFGLVTDLLTVPNLAAVPAGQYNAHFASYGYSEDCANSACPWNGYTGFQWAGTLTSLEVVAGEVDPLSVPEPATLALLSLGLTGLGFSRRREA